MPLSGKYEKILKGMCWNDAYLILGLEDHCVGNWHKNSTHFSSVAMHIGMVDMQTFMPWPCHIMLHIYKSLAASQSFYISQMTCSVPRRPLFYMHSHLSALQNFALILSEIF